MNGSPILQGGERRGGNSRRLRGLPPQRKQRRRRRLLALVLVAAVAVALVRTGSTDRADRPSRASTPRATAGLAVAPTPVAPGVPAPKPSSSQLYGGVQAPVGQRVDPKFRRPPRAGMLFDLRSGRVLWSWQAARTVPIASVTKMMTGLLAVERAAPADRVLITRTALAYAGSGVGALPRGKRVPLEPLVYGLMLPSGNDAARALAEHLGGGSIPRFVGLMNERARRLGLRCTRFTGPDGYDDANRSCPRDLAVLTRAVLARPRLARIVSARGAIFPFPIKGGKLYLASHNPLLRSGYPGATGVKTGYSEAAGLCLVGSARRGRTQLGVVLLDSPNPGLQARRLLDLGFAKLRLAATGP